MSIRKGPALSANNYRVGQKMKGIDDQLWIVKLITKNDGTKYKRWNRIYNPISKISPKISPKLPIKKLPKVKIGVGAIRAVKTDTLKNNDTIEISFTAKFKHNNETDIDFYQLASKNSDEIIKQITSEPFFNIIYNKLSHINDVKITITNVSYLIDEVLIVYIYCKLNIVKNMKLKDYQHKVQNVLTNTSLSDKINKFTMYTDNVYVDVVKI